MILAAALARAEEPVVYGPGELTVLVSPTPVWPTSAPFGSEGRCTVAVALDASGSPSEVVASGCPAPFDVAAHDALLAWRWAPPPQGPGRTVVAVRFHLAARFDDRPPDVLAALIAAHVEAPDPERSCRMRITLDPSGAPVERTTNHPALCLADAAPEPLSRSALAEWSTFAAPCVVKFSVRGHQVDVDGMDPSCPFPAQTALRRLIDHWSWNGATGGETNYLVTFALQP